MQADGSVLLATWVAAAATAATALFAAVQVGREIWRGRIRSRGAHARMETIAYQLRRQLRAWVGVPAGAAVELERGDDFEHWIRQAENAKTLGLQLDRAEKRMDDLMALQPDATPRVTRALDRAYVYFLEGTRRLNEYVAIGHPDTEGLWTWIRLRTDAEKDLRDCIYELERYILSGTLTAERDLHTRREAEDELTQLADALAEEWEETHPPDRPRQPEA